MHMHTLKGQTSRMEAEQLQARSEDPSLLAPLLPLKILVMSDSLQAQGL